MVTENQEGMMQSNEAQNQEPKKGLLRRPIKIWKLTLPLWLAVIAGCCILSVGVYVISSRGATDTPESADIEVPTDTAVPTEEPTSTPVPTEPAGRVMYFCGYDRCKDAGTYGEMLFETGINVWNNPDPDRGGVHHQANHQDQVTVVEERRVNEGPGGLWYRLEGGGWTNDLWLTKEPCTSENLGQYSFTDCLEGEY
jgi:hypothetical protein